MKQTNLSKVELFIKLKEVQCKLNEIKRLVDRKTEIKTGGNPGWITINRNNKILSVIRKIVN